MSYPDAGRQRWWPHEGRGAQTSGGTRHHEHPRHHGPGGRRHGGHGRGGGFGPGFDPRAMGFGPGFGPGFRPPFRGRKAARGDVRASVLSLLSEQPMHGYQIITELAERSGGTWRPSPGSVYPVIQQLQDEGLVRIEEADGRRVVHLTDAGREYVEAHAEELAAPWEAVGGGQDEVTGALLTAARGLAAAAWQITNAGTAADVEKATEVLTDARRRIYGILADSGPDDTPTGDTVPEA
jgi:DNA-binding PadR family transcriptional regulator